VDLEDCGEHRRLPIVLILADVPDVDGMLATMDDQDWRVPA